MAMLLKDTVKIARSLKKMANFGLIDLIRDMGREGIINFFAIIFAVIFIIFLVRWIINKKEKE